MWVPLISPKQNKLIMNQKTKAFRTIVPEFYTHKGENQVFPTKFRDTKFRDYFSEKKTTEHENSIEMVTAERAEMMQDSI